MTLHRLFQRRDPARSHDLASVEQGDELLIGFPHGFQFRAIARAEPWDDEVSIIDQWGVPMTVPGSLVLGHRERGVWQAGRELRDAA